MTYAEVVQKFLAKVQLIKSLNPKYKQPHDGSDGFCDCIGLPIGAIRRMGLKWTGIHGSNWAARKEFVQLKKINSVSDLEVGDVVLKAYEQGEKGWTLNKYPRYLPGGKYYNGDLKDYYHAGVVTQLVPELNITHMSSKMTVDKSLGRWAYGGRLKILVNASTGSAAPVIPADQPTAGCKAVVVAQKGGTVNLRNRAGGKILVRVPLGTVVDILEPGDKWARILYVNTTGYMMAEFLDIIGDGKGKY